MYSIEKNKLLIRKLDKWNVDSGITNLMYDNYKSIIEQYDKILLDKKQYFTKLELFTATIIVQLKNLTFHEDILIDKLTIPTGNILLIGCNKKELLNVNYKIPIPKVKSNRGRKKSVKKVIKKSKGNGKYFDSQITFLIQNNAGKKYPIKLFRNGKIQLPGIKEISMVDVIQPITDLHNYLNDHFDYPIEIVKIYDCVRNYKSHLISDKYRIDLTELQNIIELEKNNIKVKEMLNYIIDQSLDKSYSDEIKLTMTNFNIMNIAETLYQPDTSNNLTIKFYRPNVFKDDKKTTLRITKKGKINFEGANSDLEVKHIFKWFKILCYDNFDKIFLHESDLKNECSDECSDESIYDD